MNHINKLDHLAGTQIFIPQLCGHLRYGVMVVARGRSHRSMKKSIWVYSTIQWKRQGVFSPLREIADKRGYAPKCTIITAQQKVFTCGLSGLPTKNANVFEIECRYLWGNTIQQVVKIDTLHSSCLPDKWRNRGKGTGAWARRLSVLQYLVLLLLSTVYTS